MADQEQPPGPVRGARALSVARAGTGGALVLVLLAIGVWSARAPIATRFIDDALAERGVPARYRIAALGLNGTRLENVVIGDPRAPDLVADWIEVGTEIGVEGVRLKGVAAGHVRARARLRGGRLSFGAIDRLLPPAGTAPFALPAILADLHDARLRLTTPAGVIGARLSGRGALDSGFDGQLALIADRLAQGDCRADRLAAVLAVSVTEGQPALRGPVRAQRAGCGGVALTGLVAGSDVRLDRRFDRWQGLAQLSLDRLSAPGAQLRALSGDLRFDGGAERTRGTIDLRSGALRLAAGRAAALTLAGDFHLGRAGQGFDGRVTAEDAALAPRWQALLARQAGAAAGSPLAPLVEQAASRLGAAARRFSVAGDLRAGVGAGGVTLGLSHARLTSASGARATLSGGGGVLVSPAGWQIDGLLAFTGGGLPEAAVKLRQAAPAAPLRGTGFLRPYAAGGARLALEGLDFTTGAGGTRLTTAARLSGPIAGGAVQDLRLPLSARWERGALLLNPGCTRAEARALRLGEMQLAAPALTLCAEGAALARLAGGRLSGAARIDRPALSGTIGDTPLALAAEAARVDLGARGFALNGAQARFGTGESATRLAFGALAGTLAQGAAAGRFSGGSALIAEVPLRIDQSAGDWRFDQGVLTLGGALRVADRATPQLCPESGHYAGPVEQRPRFCQLVARDVALRLAEQQIRASGTLTTPGGVAVSRVTLQHDLARGRGGAELLASGIRFGPDFQPDALTPLTYGVISAVRGTVSGTAALRWTRDTVTSSGDFMTEGTSLAAAFGPVEGLSGTIHFTDLLKLESAPGQQMRLASVNPGVPVTEGVIRYQTLPDQRVSVEGGRWPFAGGTLVLEPTLLDFSESAERRLTFRVEAIDAAQFLQATDFKNLNATGVLDGTLPMFFDAQGGRITGGHLQMRPGGGTIAYVGELSQRDLGFWGNLAFQSLKSIAYRELEVGLNGPLEGEIITDIRFAGVRQGKGARSNFLIRRLQRLPLVFNVRVQAPFRQLLGGVADLYDPRRLVERNLDRLIQAQQGAPVQPRASGAVPQGEPK